MPRHQITHPHLRPIWKDQYTPPSSLSKPGTILSSSTDFGEEQQQQFSLSLSWTQNPDH